MAHSFIELDKAVVQMVRLVSFLWLWFSVCHLMEKDKRLMNTSWWERLTEGEAGSCFGRRDSRCWSNSCMVLKWQLWMLEWLWGDTPHPRAKEKLQQNGRRDDIVFGIKPHTHQRYSEGSNIPIVHQDPETPWWLRQNCECLLWRYRSAVDCCRGRGSGCSRPGYGISPLVGLSSSSRRSPLIPP